MRIAVLHSDVGEMPTPDDADTLAQAGAILQVLTEQGHDAFITPVEPGLQILAASLQKRGVELVFNLVESFQGSSEPACVVPDVLEAEGLMYTGASSEALRTTGNKLSAKAAMQAASIPTPPWAHGGEAIPESVNPDSLCIIKSVWEHGSFGLDESAVQPWRHASEALASKEKACGGQWFAEGFVDGREFCVGLLEMQGKVVQLPTYEILFEQWTDRPKMVDYAAKWDDASHQARHTVRCWEFPQKDKSLLRRMETAALACWRRFGLTGYARVDFRLDANGMPWVIDINANPCLSPDAGFAAQLTRGSLGLQYGVASIVNAAIRRKAIRDVDHRRVA